MSWGIVMLVYKVTSPRSCLDKRGMINKVTEVKPICFYICKTKSYTWNGKIFCFINSWGCHVLNRVKQRSSSSCRPVNKNDGI